ncbi:uncharacterized protein LOC123316759 isoform X1 [Coccinella septempunctata]|uniref:uncharacterized protein LOC123316759 isoform X1 n=1 Tax=Coccinella septempunctata TaxID=41139 RepID=UPI001D092EF2|nr:uncharacterized protein LOC123316759 isoform X1 [Coccinella septempunctata]
MSSEVEPGKDPEDTKVDHKRTFKQKINDYWQIGLKVLELLVCATCMALIYDPAQGTRIGKSHLEVLAVMYTTYSGFLIINLMFLLGRSMKEIISYKTNVIFSAAGSVMFVFTAIMLLKAKADLQPHHFFHPNTHHLVMLVTTVIFSFINATIFAIDVFLHLKYKKDFMKNA